MKIDKKFAVFYALIVAVLVLHYFYLPENGFRFNDAGHKYIQMRSIYENKWQDVSISYPGISIDPGFKLIRTVFGHKNGKLYGFYQPLFAFIVSLFYPFLGSRAVFFLPMLSFFISVIILHKILIIVARDRSFRFILLFIYAFASPVILYSFMFWEHTTALMMMMLSLLYFVKYDYVSNKISDLLMTSVFIFISVIFRSEMLMFAVPYMILIGVYLFLNKKKRVVGKLGQLDVLRALEPKEEDANEINELSQFGFSSNFVHKLRTQRRMTAAPLKDLCSQASQLKVEDFMQTPSEGEFIEQESSLEMAVLQLVMGHHISLLVTRNQEIIGILRMTDVFAAVFHTMKECEL